MTIRADRSGPLRTGHLRAVEPMKPQAGLPALATIAAFAAKRPPWAMTEPFHVPLELFNDAEIEMRQEMQKRGFPLPQSGELARDGVRHFMFNGIVVVIGG